MTYKLAVVATHPVQYQAPLWRAIAASPDFDVKVYFASRQGLDEAMDPGFGKAFAWDIPLLGGYDHEFLTSVRIPILPGPIANLYPKGLADRFRMEKFDATLVLGYATGAAWAGMRAAWRTGTPVIMRGESHNQGRRPSPREAAKGAVLRRLLRRIDGFLAIGTWNKEYWLSFGVPEEKIRVALYSVDNDYFRSRLESDPEEPGRLRARWGTGPDDVVFLYCGKLIPAKDPLTLFRAFADLEGDRHHLVIVGAGLLEEELRDFARAKGMERVHWEGFVNQSRLPFYYRAADVLVLPSVVEPWGLVVNEAMACGTPCIVSDRAGAGPDLVAGPGVGCTFSVSDAANLEELLRKSTDASVRQEWEQGAAKAISRATMPLSVEGLVELVEVTASHRANGGGRPVQSTPVLTEESPHASREVRE